MTTLGARAVLLLGLTSSALAVDWHFLTYYPSSGQQFTRFAGDMVVPDHSKLNGGGPFYLWPGLQTTDNSGVYQNVLDSRNGGWFFGSGWCCSNPSLPWGGGENPANGDTVHFDNVKTSDTDWTSTTSDGSKSATNSFAIGSKNFNQVLFAIEIYDGSWTFGPLEFSNIVIETTGGTDASWCNGYPSDYNGGTNFAATDISSETLSNGVRCKIGSLVMKGPNGDP